MALANVTAADVLKNQAVRDAAVKVALDFQTLSQSNSAAPSTLDEVQERVTALVTALTAAGGIAAAS